MANSFLLEEQRICFTRRLSTGCKTSYMEVLHLPECCLQPA